MVNDTFEVQDIFLRVVSAIDAVSLNNGTTRKRLKLKMLGEANLIETFWIEGIGSEFGLTTHFRFCGTDYSERLLCYYSNVELKYPAFPPSCFITPVVEIINGSGIVIDTNPAEELIMIDDEALILERYWIYDLSGSIYKKGALSNMGNEIQLDGIKSGVYLLLFTTSNGDRYSQKLIKI